MLGTCPWHQLVRRLKTAERRGPVLFKAGTPEWHRCGNREPGQEISADATGGQNGLRLLFAVF